MADKYSTKYKSDYFQNRIADYSKAKALKSLPTTPANGQCLVLGTLALVLRVSSWFGVAPLRFIRVNHDLHISYSKAMYFYSFMLIIIMDITLLYWYIVDLNVDPVYLAGSLTYTDRIIWAVDLGIVSLTVNFGVFSAASRMKRMIPCLSNLNVILTKLNKYQQQQRPDERKKCIVIIVCLFLMALLFSANFYYFYMIASKWNGEGCIALLYISFYIMYFILILLVMQFFVNAMKANWTLRIVNDQLTEILVAIDTKIAGYMPRAAESKKEFFIAPLNALNVIVSSVKLMDRMPDTDILPTPQSKQLKDKIRRLSIAYITVCDIIRQINRNFGVLLLLLLVSILIHLVETPYHFIQWLLNPQGIQSGIMELTWCGFHVATLLAVVEPGFRTAIEMDSIQLIISQLMSRVTLSDPMAAELDLFCRQVALNRVFYTPMGMCVLSRGLLSTIFGAVTTYLVIIVQFQTL